MSLRTVAALTIAFSLTLAAIGAVTAVPARGDVPGVHPAQTTPPATGDWHHVDLEAFGVWLPQGWQYEERQGVDSFVGAFVGDGARLTFDYGRYSNSLPDLGTPGYDVSFEEIGGSVRCASPGSNECQTGPAIARCGSIPLETVKQRSCGRLLASSP